MTYVVVNDVEPAVPPHDLLVQGLDLRLVDQIGPHDVFSDGVPGLIDPGNHAAPARESPGHRLADLALGTVDHANPTGEPRHRHLQDCRIYSAQPLPITTRQSLAETHSCYWLSDSGDRSISGRRPPSPLL